MGCLTISAKAVPSDLQIAAENKNTGLTLTAKNKNVRLTLTAALVCGIGLDKYEFLYVDEGPLIVEDGYLKVLKKKD